MNHPFRKKVPATGLTIGPVILELSAGKKLSRAAWENAFIFMVPGSTVKVGAQSVSYPPRIDIVLGTTVNRWIPETLDLLADDWKVVD